MRYEISLLPFAEEEIKEAFLWYFQRSPVAADAFRAEVFAAMERRCGCADAWPAGGGKDEDSQPASCEVLLIPQVLIGGQEDLEPFSLSGRDQRPVLQRAPAQLEGGFNGVSDQRVAQRRRRTLVEENAH